MIRHSCRAARRATAFFSQVKPPQSEHGVPRLDMAGKRAGFTLIELLIVVVIIGILAMIAIPKFSNTKGKAMVTAIKSDLRNLASAEEAYLFDNDAYTSVITSLTYQSSPGVVL